MHIRVTGFKYLIVEEYLFEGPSIQQQRAVDRTMVRHLARHPELNLSRLIMVDSFNESPYQVLQYSYRHFIPFFEHNVEKEGPEGPNCRQYEYRLKSPMCYASSSLERKLA